MNIVAEYLDTKYKKYKLPVIRFAFSIDSVATFEYSEVNHE